MDFNLEYYRTFYYVASYSSISKAADSLCLSQPAVSRSIKKLEEKLGCQLFQRVSSGVVLTSEGEILRKHVAQAFSAFQQGEQEVGHLAAYKMGTIKIGTTETPLYQCLIPILVEFQKRYPQIRMDITGCITAELGDNLKNGAIDVAFAVSPLPSDMNCRTHPLEPIEDVFIAGPAFSQLQGRCVSLEEIMTHPIAYVDPHSSAGGYLADWFAQQKMTFQPQFTVRTSTLVLPLVESGLAIGIVPRSILSRSHPDQGIFELKLEQQIPAREILLAVNETLPMSAVCREFVASILSE